MWFFGVPVLIADPRHAPIYIWGFRFPEQAQKPGPFAIFSKRVCERCWTEVRSAVQRRTEHTLFDARAVMAQFAVAHAEWRLACKFIEPAMHLFERLAECGGGFGAMLGE